MQRDMFITMIYAVIDLETEELRLARAGHELTIFYDQHTEGEGSTSARSNLLAWRMAWYHRKFSTL